MVDVIRWLIFKPITLIIFFILLFLMIYFIIFKSTSVKGTIETTLTNNNISPKIVNDDIQRFSLVLTENKLDETEKGMERIIALPDEKVKIIDNTLIVEKENMKKEKIDLTPYFVHKVDDIHLMDIIKEKTIPKDYYLIFKQSNSNRTVYNDFYKIYRLDNSNMTLVHKEEIVGRIKGHKRYLRKTIPLDNVKSHFYYEDKDKIISSFNIKKWTTATLV